MRKPKEFVSLILFAFLFVLLTLDFSSCTHDNQVLDEFIPGPTQDFSKTELLSKKVTTAPTIDATIDAVWDDVQKLITTTTVLDPGDDVFNGYVGDAYEVTLRSVYDDNNVYFLAEWNDKNLDFNRQTWYFDPDDKLWKQESRYPTFNNQGTEIRAPFYEDKFAFLFNVNNSTAGWDAATCFATCHTGLPEADGYARHYTANASETIDMWHWKSVRTGPNGQMDDQYQNETYPNGRHSDTKITGGYTNNKQDLTVTGGSDVVSVPLYVIPGRTYYFWITQAEIDNGTAKTITAVDSEGILSYDGGTIDPYADLDFRQEGSTVGAKGIPSIYTAPFEGSRGDLTAEATYTGSGWILEIQRALKTGDTENQDVDFSDLTDKPFGIGVFDNSAIAHSTMGNLLMKFEQ